MHKTLRFLVLLSILCVALGHDDDVSNSPTFCPVSMFSGQPIANKWASLACMTTHAMNWNWFPSQIQGMISYQAWNSMRGFWQSGSALEAMANTLIYSNHTRQISVLLTSWRSLESLLLAYGPLPSFDDMVHDMHILTSVLNRAWARPGMEWLIPAFTTYSKHRITMNSSATGF